MKKTSLIYGYTLNDIERVYNSPVNTLKDLLDRLNVSATFYDFIDATLFNTLFKHYIKPRFNNYFYLLSNEDLDFSNDDNLFKDWSKAPMVNLGYKLIDFINTTAVKYTKVYNAYNKELTDLIGKVQTITSTDVKSISNDTPQTSEEEELFADKYASFINHNIATQTTSDDVQPYLDRIQKLYISYLNIMSEWASLFVEYLEGLEI